VIFNRGTDSRKYRHPRSLTEVFIESLKKPNKLIMKKVQEHLKVLFVEKSNVKI